MSREPGFEEGAELLRVLGHAVRLTLLAAIVEGERAVGEIEALTGVVQPLLSQQLGVLRKAELVETRRDAKQVFYRLNRERIRSVGALLDRIVGTDAPSPGIPPAQAAKTGGSAAMFARVE